MAVNGRLDVAALIAESIDRYYAKEVEPAWRSDYLKWLALHIESLEQRRADGLLREHAEHPQDPDYRKGYKTGWAQSHRPGPGRGLPAGVSGMYQEGFKAGQGGQQKAQEYLSHYNAVKQGGGDRAAVSKMAMGFFSPHYDRVTSKARGDQDIEDNIANWVSGSSGERGLPALATHTAQEFEKFNASSLIPDDAHDPNHAPHPADLGDIYHRRAGSQTKEQIELDKKAKEARDRAAAEKRDQGYEAQTRGKESQPAADSPQHLLMLKKNVEAEHGFTHDDLLAHGYGSHEARAAHSQAVSARDAGQEHAAEHIIPGLEAFQGENYHTDPARYSDMVKHAHDDWIKGISNHLLQQQAAGQHGVLNQKIDVVTGHSPHAETGHMQEGPGATLDPVQAVIAGLRDPAGFRSMSWKVRAVRQQPGFENFNSGRAETIEGRKKREAHEAVTGEKIKPRKPTTFPRSGTIDRAVADAMKFMYNNNPSAHIESPMWDFHFGNAEGFADVRKKHKGDIQQDKDTDLRRTKVRPARWGQLGGEISPRSKETAERLQKSRADADRRTYTRRKKIEQALGLALSIFEDWIQEHVSVPEGQMDNIMEDLFSRVQVTYGQLFEVENN